MAPTTTYDDGLQVVPPDFEQKQAIGYYGAGIDGKEIYHGVGADEKEVHHGFADGRKKKRICGLSPMIFWPLVVIAVLVVAGAVGGGVGGSMASKNASIADGNKKSSRTGLPTDTNTVPAGQLISSQDPNVMTTPLVSASDQQQTTSKSSGGISIPSSQTSSALSTTGTSTITSPSSTSTTNPTTLDDANCSVSNGTMLTSLTSTFTTLCATNIIGVGRIIDLGSVRTSTLQSCIDVCTEWNANLKSGARKCVAVSWAVKLPGVDLPKNGGDYKTCWYKWATSLQQYTPDLKTGLGSVSAVLVG